MTEGCDRVRRERTSTQLKIVLVGDGGVGKSCLINRFVSNAFQDVSFYTVGVEFVKKDLEVDGELFTLQIWDTAGQERFKSLRTSFYRGSDICMLIYAINDKSAFKNLTIWKNEFLYYADVDDEASFPFVVVGTKCDVPLLQKQVTLNDLEVWCEQNQVPYSIETSARTNVNVHEAFIVAVRRWRQNENCRDERDNWGETVELTQINNTLNPGNSGCC